jgi:hypothetical protein
MVELREFAINFHAFLTGKLEAGVHILLAVANPIQQGGKTIGLSPIRPIDNLHLQHPKIDTQLQNLSTLRMLNQSGVRLEGIKDPASQDFVNRKVFLRHFPGIS